MLTDSNPSADLLSLRTELAELLETEADWDEQEAAFLNVEADTLRAQIGALEVSLAALAAIASSDDSTAPVFTIKVRRDVREFGVKRTRFVGSSLRGRLETYRHEQTRFDFAPTFVDETVEVAVIDETCGQFRLEFASEQHLWASYNPWGDNDPTPTVVADSDEDSQLSGRGVYSVRGVVA